MSNRLIRPIDQITAEYDALFGNGAFASIFGHWSTIRIAIVELMRSGPITSLELHTITGFNQTTIDKHLTVLRHRGFVDTDVPVNTYIIRIGRPPRRFHLKFDPFTEQLPEVH